MDPIHSKRHPGALSAWLPAALWLAAMLLVSVQSVAVTREMLSMVAGAAKGIMGAMVKDGLSAETADLVGKVACAGVVFLGYAVLALLLLRALRLRGTGPRAAYGLSLSGCVLSGVLYLRSRRQPYFLLCCFYGCFGMGLLYWLLYTLLITDAPPMFYVSDIGWISCFIFLLLLQYSLVDEEERLLRSRAPWLALAVEIPLTAYFVSIGDVLYNLIVGTLMTAMLWLML